MDRRAMMASLAGLVLLGVASTTASCVDGPSLGDCEQACSLAARCRLLPSALGGSEDDCTARCVASDASTRQVLGLLERLGQAEVAQPDPLCSAEGTNACQDVIAALENDAATSELEVTTELTVRMTSAASQVTNRSLSSWCCFDYFREIDGTGTTDIDEVAAIYDMIEPTRECVNDLSTLATAAVAALQQMTPDTAEAAAQCECIRARWATPPEGTVPADFCPLVSSFADDACRFARQSSQLVRLGLPNGSCELGPLRELSESLSRTTRDWSLTAEGPLLDASSQARPLAEIHEQLRARIHGELTRPRGFLEEACLELEQELGAGCEGLELAVAPAASACAGGPTCSAAECLEEAPSCDSTSCDADSPPPGRECGALGITSIRLGYRTAQGSEVLGEPIAGCETLGAATTTFEGVKVGLLVPFALVSGTLPTSFVPRDATTIGDGSFSWIVEGDARWVAAGEALLELPSPLLELRSNEIEDPLEQLGWVAPRLPIGQACDTDPDQCEGYFNDNCDNGIDDDGDGLIDDASPWCDRLLEEAERRCVVVAPGRGPFPGCQPS